MNLKLSACLGITLAKAVKTGLRAFHYGGTNLPGVIAEKIDSNILVDLSEDVKTVLITGTNGKSTSLRMLEQLLDSEGIRYFSNYEGANIATGIASTFISNASWNGRAKIGLALIECDEKYVDRMCRELHPKIVLVTNLYEDQKERFGSVTDLAKSLSKSLKNSEAVLCLNEDCEALAPLFETNARRTIGYRVDGEDVVVGNERISVQLNVPGEWNLSNAAGVCAVAKQLGLNSSEFPKVFNQIVLPYGRMESIKIGTSEVLVNLAKNPNSMDSLLQYLCDEEKPDVLVIGINARTGDIANPNWLMETEKLNLIEKFQQVWVYGDSRDVAANIIKEQLPADLDVKLIDSAEEVIREIANREVKVAMLLNYTCMMETRRLMLRAGCITDAFWVKRI